MHPIARRVLDGEAVCPSEISLDNAARLRAWIDDTSRHHAKDDCTGGKNCVHEPGLATVEWEQVLTREATHLCVCGQHGSNEPDKARAIANAYFAKWSRNDTRIARIHRASR